MRSRSIVVAAVAPVVALALLCGMLPASAQAAPSLTVSVRGGANRPVGAARVSVTGAGVAQSAVTNAEGEAALVLPPGVYRVTVSASAFAPETRPDVVVVPGSTARIEVMLTAQNAPAEIGRTRATTGAATLNSSITAVSSVDTARETATVGNPTLQNYAYQVPGLHYFRGSKSSTEHFKIRGADNEPRTQLDGFPLTNTGAGNFLVGWLNAYAFDRIDVEKGVGIAQGDEGRTAFGTINLVSRGFSSQPSYEAALGFDSAYGSYDAFTARGALGDRLQYVFSYNTAGLPDPAHNAVGSFIGPALTNVGPGGAVIAYNAPLSGPVTLRNEIAKVRYRFSPVTSLEAGYTGFQGTAAALGGNYLGYEGTFPIASSSFAYAGTRQALYSGYPFGSEQNNEPFFQASLQTHVGPGTLTLRQIAGSVTDTLTYTKPAAPIANLPNGRFTSDGEHGFQLGYVYPLANGYVRLFYDYHSDGTTVYTGAPFTNATLTTPLTTLHENDLSLTSALDLTPRLSLGLGLFSVASHYDAWYQNPGPILGGASPGSLSYAPTVVSFNKLLPHVGLTYRPDDRTSLRASFGSSLYGPGSTLVSGRAAYTPPAPSNSNLGLLTLVNPSLKPEIEVAYGIGADRRLGDGTVVGIDGYYTAVYNKFLSLTYQGGPFATASGSVSPLVVQTVNAALQRNFGLELDVHRQPALGLGYDLAVSLNRQYFDGIPLSYFAFVSGPLTPFNDYQGATNPYSTIHAELRYATRSGLIATLGSDTVGADNTLRARGYTTMYGALQQRIARGAAIQLSAENLWNVQTAAGIVGAGPAGSGASTITARPVNGPKGGPYVYSATPASVLGITPLVVRLSVLLRAGRAP